MVDENKIHNMIDRAIHGDAYDLVEECIPYIKARLRRKIPKQDFDDIVQNTLHKMLLGLHQMQDYDKFLGWLGTIAYSEASEYWRLKYRDKMVQNLPDETDDIRGCQDPNKPEDTTVIAEQNLEIEKAIQNLPLKLQNVISLYYKDGMSWCSIAHMLGKPQGTIRRWAKEARELLKKELNS